MKMHLTTSGVPLVGFPKCHLSDPFVACEAQLGSRSAIRLGAASCVRHDARLMINKNIYFHIFNMIEIHKFKNVDPLPVRHLLIRRVSQSLRILSILLFFQFYLFSYHK